MTVDASAVLHEWLRGAIDTLPTTGQIILNFDGEIVKWETKAAYIGHDRNGDQERTEVRRFGSLRVNRQAPRT